MPTENSKQKTISEGEIVFNPPEVTALLRDAGYNVPSVSDEEQHAFYVTCPHNGLQIDVKALGGLKFWWKEKGEVAPSAVIVEPIDDSEQKGTSH